MSAIEARDLSRSYRGPDRRVEVLLDVSVEPTAGKVTALVGRSGSGKSTLLNILGTLTKADSGELRILGRDVGGMTGDDLAQLRSQYIGFVFQACNLLPHLTAQQNVALPFRGGSRAGLPVAAEILGSVGLQDRLRHRPGELSAGEQQRVALARALVNDPAVVLADEPTGNLDIETERVLLDLFRAMADAGRAVLLVTHTSAVADSADTVLRIEHGRMELGLRQ